MADALDLGSSSPGSESSSLSACTSRALDAIVVPLFGAGGGFPSGAVSHVALMDFANAAGEVGAPVAGAVLVREFHPGGGLRVCGWMVDGRRGGMWREWHETGSLASETMYADGLREGVSLSCYRDGFPKAVRWFRGDLECGVRLIWYRDGRHWQEEYAGGVRQGLWREYVDGVLRVEGRYAGNVKAGGWRRWDAAGRPIR